MLSIGQKLVALITLVLLVGVVAVFSPVFAVVTLFVAVPLAIAILRR